MGCGKYKQYDPSPVGVFYPNECVHLRGRKAHGFLLRPDVYTVCHPVSISEVGIMTQYEPENAGDHEVARLEFSDGGVYVWTSTLRGVGRIEYQKDNRTRLTVWRKIDLGFWSIIRSKYVLIGLLALGILGRLFAGGGGGTWSGGGSTSTGGSWSGGGTFK